jgi:hypothetical protein
MSGLTAAMTGIVRPRWRQRLVTFEGEHRHQDHGEH